MVPPCVYHTDLCLGNLLGTEVPMVGRIPMAGGRPVKSDGRKGMVYDASPEAKAFSRWQNKQFSDVERLFAQQWRASLEDLDLLAVAARHQSYGCKFGKV